MPGHLIPASDRQAWREVLAGFASVDASHLPEYHLAYALRVPGARAWLWHWAGQGEQFAYPFLLTPVAFEGAPAGLFDVSSAYGYTGPLASTGDPEVLRGAWAAFDEWAAARGVIAEFVRFSPFVRNERLAHPDASVTVNRELAASLLPATPADLLGTLGTKTRNMLRKAQRAGLVGRELSLPEALPEFRELYESAMRRNNAAPFFWYDDAYWNELLRLGAASLRLFAACENDRMVAASMAVVHGANAVYHLGAALPEAARLGGGNLSTFCMSCGLLAAGVRFLNMTGGRTTAPDDPLLLFKRSNATGTVPFHVGRRVVDAAAYNSVARAWLTSGHTPPDPGKVIFWRA